MKCLKVLIKLEKLVQSIQRNFDKSTHRKERMSFILDCPVHCSSIAARHGMSFKLNELKNSMKQFQTHLQQFLFIVPNILEVFLCRPVVKL